MDLACMPDTQTCTLRAFTAHAWCGKLIQQADVQPSTGGAPTAARFDLSGLYLSVGGTEARVVGAKQDWAQLANLSGAIGSKVGPSPCALSIP